MRALWLLACCAALASSRAGPVYHNQFAVRVPAGRAQADVIAARHGFTNLGQIGKLPGYYLFEHQHVHKRSLTPSEIHRHKLSSEPEVHWVQQQHEKVRKKRDFFVELQPAAPGVLPARRDTYSGYLEPDGQEEKILSPQHGLETVFYTCNEKEMTEQTRYCKAHEHFNTSVTGDTAKD
ncbi:furin-like isoform X2 [Bacillus rossius redtenbacheri]|uniref:furin-like isoform X2 n=1 Tax=Bacillus rossius redtenbacheri TaxID=93214 RepID=UPI002FDD407F